MHCEYDGTQYADEDSVTVGPYSSSGTKSLSIECWGIGETQRATKNVSLTVTQAPAPTISTTLSSTLLEAGVDSLTVTWSTQYTDYCSSGGNNSYPTGGTANLGTYSAGTHSLSFSCTGDGGTTSHTISWEALNRPTVTPSASPATVKANGTSTVSVSWNSPDADSCTHGGTSYDSSDSISFGPYSYSQAGPKSTTVSCTNRLGTESGTASWTVEALAPTVTASLNPTSVLEDTGTSTLSWSSSNSDSCSRGGTAVSTRGSTTVGPYATPDTYTFNVSCTGTGGTASDSATLTVEEVEIPDPPTVTVSLNPAKVLADSGTSTLSWSSTGASSCTRDGSTVATSGSATVGPVSAGSHSYAVSCTGTGGSGSDSATLTAVSPPTVTVSADPTSVTAGEDTVELTWSSTNAMSCTYDGTSLTTGGTRTVGPFTAGSHTLTVSCAGMVTGASASDSVDITAVAAPTVTASLNPATVTAHVGETDLTWSSTGATACSLNDGSSLQTSGTLTRLGPFYAGSYSFTVTCENSQGIQRSRTVTVTAQASSTALCSAETAAPANASSLSLGSHTFSVTGSTSGSVWGTGTYTADSDIATAATHAGHVASGHTAIVTLTRTAGQSSYTGSTQNGVTSNSHAAATGSYTLSLVGACRADPPNAPENLTATPNPSTDGNAVLSWDVPASGATPTGYLVYLQDSTSGPLTKTFADRTLSLSGLEVGSYTYKAYACSGTESDPDCGSAASLTVTVQLPDADSDGIPDADDPDDDNDGMSDLWELGADLDPTNSSDARLDDDNDGYNNLAEYNAGTDPNWAESHPDQIPAVSFGFNDNFIVQKGRIDSDALDDLLIRDPTPRTLPGISDFVLIKNSEGGFDLEDADEYTIGNPLTDISSIAEVADVNGDGSKDLILVGLGNHFTGSSDWIVYGNTDRQYAIPQTHTNIPDLTTKFFRELSGWVDNANYFEDNLPKVAKVATRSFLLDAEGDIVTGENSDETQSGASGSSGENCFEGSLCGVLGDPVCTEFNIDCDYFTGDRNDIYGLSFTQVPSGDRNIIYGQWATDPCASGQFVCDYGSESYVVSIRDAVDDPAQENVTVGIRTTFDASERVTVRDFSGYNPDAYALYRDYLPAVRSSGAVQPGSPAALMIAGTLEAYLGTTVFDGGLSAWGHETLPDIEDHSSFSGGVGEMLNVLGYFRDAMPQREAYREGIPLDERMSSGYWDLLNGLDPCTYEENGVCNISHFPDDIRPDIRSKLDELLADLASETYASADAAARALHDSDLKELAYYLNIEIAVVIDDSTSSVRIDDFLQTRWSSEGVRTNGLEAGKPVWHTHPNGTYVWWADATVYIQNNKSFVCNLQSRDFTIYVSGRDLTKAGVRQVFNARVAGERFDYLVDSENVWQNRVDQYDFDHPDFDSEMLNIACPD